MEVKMIRKALFTLSMLMGITLLAACSPAQSTSTPVPNMPNPAAVYCEQHGGKSEIVTAADGSQSGLCIFPDGSACDEWAYFRGECGPAGKVSPMPAATVKATLDASGGFMPPGTSEEFADWWGFIKSTEPGAQYDDYFERQDLESVIYFGIDSALPEVKSQIEALRDSGKIVHLYGTLLSNVPDYNGSQVKVDRIEVEE
jgi:putative hemolysin